MQSRRIRMKIYDDLQKCLQKAESFELATHNETKPMYLQGAGRTICASAPKHHEGNESII